jgi:Protein of unknown function (DUF1573)
MPFGVFIMRFVHFYFEKMKKGVLMMFIYFLLLSCGGNRQPAITDMVNIPASSGKGLDKSNLPVIKFEEQFFDFGEITQGQKVSHDFKFENTGVNELVLSAAYADCGCTVAEVPRQPIPAGKSNAIRVTFDSAGKTGIVNKSITLETNCIPTQQIIKIKASITQPKP